MFTSIKSFQPMKWWSERSTWFFCFLFASAQQFTRVNRPIHAHRTFASLATTQLLVNVAFLSLFLYLLFVFSYKFFCRFVPIIILLLLLLLFFPLSLFWSSVYFDRYAHSIFKRHPLVIIAAAICCGFAVLFLFFFVRRVFINYI